MYLEEYGLISDKIHHISDISDKFSLLNISEKGGRRILQAFLHLHVIFQLANSDDKIGWGEILPYW